MLCLAAAFWVMFIPGLASAQSADVEGGVVESSPVIQGTVKDDSGLAVAGAVVTLETSASAGQRTAITDQAGSFRFPSVEPGNYNDHDRLPPVSRFGPRRSWRSLRAITTAAFPVLQVAAVSSSVNVTLPPHELAAEQLKAEEKQRLLGVFPISSSAMRRMRPL